MRERATERESNRERERESVCEREETTDEKIKIKREYKNQKEKNTVIGKERQKNINAYK